MAKKIYWFVLLYVASLLTVGIFMFAARHFVIWLAHI